MGHNVRVERQIIGWKELVNLPDLGIFGLEAKIDTGAKTSALHVDALERIQKTDGTAWVRFRIGDTPAKGHPPLTLKALLLDTRLVRSSNGESELRHVIRTALVIGSLSRQADITLTNRTNMNYPILVGRTALRSGFLVHPGRSFLLSAEAKQTAPRIRKTKEAKS
jgi:hypothetical protein